MSICPICNTQNGNTFAENYKECVRCGGYKTSRMFDMTISSALSDGDRTILSGIIRHHTDRHGEYSETITP